MSQTFSVQLQLPEDYSIKTYDIYGTRISVSMTSILETSKGNIPKRGGVYLFVLCCSWYWIIVRCFSWEKYYLEHEGRVQQPQGNKSTWWMKWELLTWSSEDYVCCDGMEAFWIVDLECIFLSMLCWTISFFWWKFIESCVVRRQSLTFR